MKNITAILILGLLINGCAQPSPNTAITPEAIKINSFLQELVERQQIPGLTLAATRNDSIVYVGAFGFRNVTTKEPMKPSYNFHWASVSKTFVATAIMQLVEKGKLKLDDQVITHVPYFSQKDKNYKDITIRQILNHTSGLGDVDDYEWDKPQNDAAAPERYVKSLKNDKMKFTPGTDWAYSNTAFEILGVVITNVSGMPFETYIKKNIFDPLGMDHSSFIYPEIPDSLRVSGHLWAGRPIVSNVYPYNKIHAPSSTLNSSVIDMTHYAMANLNRGKYKNAKLLSDTTYNILWTNSVNLKDKPAVGAGWFLDQYKGLKAIRHSGGDTGFRSFLLLVPEKNIAVMLVSNYEMCPTNDIAYAVLDMLLGEKPQEMKRHVGFSFAEILVKDGVEKAKAFYKETKKDSTQHRYYLWKEDEEALTYPGYVLLEQKLLDEALEVFKFNLEINPESGHAYGQLGVAYANAGKSDLARLNLRKAIELVPSEKYFKDELKKLDKEKSAR